ncbi:ankyrin repeat domain-containing protein [Hydrogenophaga sp. BPS33]|uniref:ankyrin repeat domain-containing protein n=1 Tax=Hydrogenophaga sp. BPS33 TaxID=2651974 RepID=UPI00135AFA99|nr:ankyrin repeat domain-containing protein [Hydrogenophaga sp. BPS33]
MTRVHTSVVPLSAFPHSPGRPTETPESAQHEQAPSADAHAGTDSAGQATHTAAAAATSPINPPTLPVALTLSPQAQDVLQTSIDSAQRLETEKWTPLHAAAKVGDIEHIAQLLDAAEIPIDGPLATGATPLHIAIEYNQLEAAKRLVAAGADVRRPRKDGATPLHLACHHGRGDIVRWLQPLLRLDVPPYHAGAALNARTRSGLTPLSLAAGAGHGDVVQFLLGREGIDPTLTDADGGTALHAAARTPNTHVAALLLRTIAVDAPDAMGATPFMAAIQQGQCAVAELLRHLGADLHGAMQDGTRPLHHACRNPDTRVLEWLLAQPGLDPNLTDFEGYAPLHEAILEGRDGVVAALLAHADIDIESALASGATPFLLALEHQQMGIANQLWVAGACPTQPTKDGVTPLHQACTHPTAQMARALLEHPEILEVHGQACDMPTVLNQTTKKGETLLHWAARAGNAELVALLLGQPGIHPNGADERGWTPLHVAARAGRDDIVGLLLGHADTDVFAKGALGFTVLHCAAIGPDTLQVAQAVRRALPPGDYAALCATGDACGTWPATLAAQRGEPVDVIQALRAPAPPTLWTPHHTSYNRGWLITGCDLPSLNARQLVDDAKQAGIDLYTYGDGRIELSWKELHQQPIQDGDFVIWYGHSFWDNELQQVMVQLGRNERVPLVAVARYFLEKGVSKVWMFGCEAADAVTPMRNCFQNGPYMPEPLDPAAGYAGVVITVVSSHRETLVSLNNHGIRLVLQDCAAERVQAGSGNRLQTRSVLPASSLQWDARQTRWSTTKNPALTVHTMKDFSPAEAEEAKVQLMLFYAMEDQVEEVEALVTRHGVDPNAADESGWTALNLACHYGHHGLAERLIQVGGHLNQADRAGNLPMALACREGHLALVELLLKHGAAVDQATPKRPHTPLMVASERGHVKLVKYLMEHGADRHRMVLTKTALDFARAAGHEDVVRLLRGSSLPGT